MRWVTMYINDELTQLTPCALHWILLLMQYPLAADATPESASAMPGLEEGDFQVSIEPEGYFKQTVSRWLQHSLQPTATEIG